MSVDIGAVHSVVGVRVVMNVRADSMNTSPCGCPGAYIVEQVAVVSGVDSLDLCLI